MFQHTPTPMFGDNQGHQVTWSDSAWSMHYCKVRPRGSAVKLLLDVSLVMNTWAEFPDNLLSVQLSLAQVLKQRRILKLQYTDPQGLEFYTPRVKSEKYLREPQFSLLNWAASSLLFSFSSFAHKLKTTTLRKEAGLSCFLKELAGISFHTA